MSKPYIRFAFFLILYLVKQIVICSPLIGPITLGKYLDTGLIKFIFRSKRTKYCILFSSEWF